MSRIKLVSEVAGKVWKIEKPAGSDVDDQETVMLIESMKMEIPVASTARARVIEILVQEGDEVRESQVVAVLEA